MVNVRYLTLGIAVALLPMVLMARPVASVTVRMLGQSESSQASDQDICKSFKPTVAQIKRYFEHAYPVPAHMTMDTYYSPCYAKGHVVFSDGSEGDWRLRSSGAAGLEWSMGGGVDLLYLDNPWHDPQGGYDIK